MDDEDKRVVVRIILEICSASLSVLGSTTIIFKIWHDRSQNGSMMPYDRIMLGLSISDMIANITWPLANFLSPSGTHVWAFGSPAACQASGFLTQLSFSSWWYNCILSYYFLLTVISQVRRKNLVRKFELLMHLSVIIFPVTAIIGLRRGWYSSGELITVCKINDPTILWIVGGIPVFFTYISLIINNILIYAIVRKQLQTSEQAAGIALVQKQLKREAKTLMFLYVGCFFITVSPSLTLNILELHFGDTYGENMNNFYPIFVLESMLLPLQGFFNFFIYIKPTYARFRVINPDKPMLFVLRQALFNPNVPQLTSNVITEVDAPNPNRALFNANFRPHSSSSDSSSSNDSNSSSSSE